MRRDGAHGPERTGGPELAVGVVLFRNPVEELRRLICSLEQNRAALGSVELQVRWRDNSPTDALGQVLGELGVREGYHFADANPGFGAAHNALMAAAFARPSVRAYVCVNPDAVLHPDCLRELLAAAERQARPGLVEAMQFPDEHPKTYDPVTYATAWCSGCVLLITRALYEELGGFDENIFMYCEDVDLSWRARASGFSTSIAPRALAHHFVGDRVVTPQVQCVLLRSEAYLGLKYGSPDFTHYCLEQHAALGGQPFELPQVPEPTSSMRAVADFRAPAYLSPVRW